ncbi:MAG: hypothetical protein AAGH15_25330, partial [Myxococcota bacterium]
GLGAPGRGPRRTVAYADGAELVDTLGRPHALSGRPVDVATWSTPDGETWVAGTALLLGDPEGLAIEVFAPDGRSLRRGVLDVAASARFAPGNVQALVDRVRGDVVFFDRELREVRRLALPPEAAPDVVVATGPSRVSARVGETVWWSTRAGLERVGVFPELRQLAAGPSTFLLFAESYAVLSPEGEAPTRAPLPLSAPLTGEALLVSFHLVTTAGLSFPASSTEAPAFRGPGLDDMVEVHGGPLVDADASARAYAVRRADGLVDIMEWGAGLVVGP